jgi:anti-repressor protein
MTIKITDIATIETALAPVDHQGAQMIDARALHGWLGPKQRFNDWVRERLSQYAFEEGTDFYCFSSKTGGRPRTDYFLTINMAKELAMVERTPIGQMTRRYFIKMEEAALERSRRDVAEGTTDKIPLAFMEALQMQQQINLQILEQLKQMQVAKADNVVALPEPKAPVKPDLTKDYYTSKELVGLFQLAGAFPSQSEFTSASIKLGQRLSMHSRLRKVKIVKDCTGQYPKTLYAREIIEEVLPSIAA